jgi:hypothetical protein
MCWWMYQCCTTKFEQFKRGRGTSLYYGACVFENLPVSDPAILSGPQYGALSIGLDQRFLTFDFCGPPLNHYWKPWTPKPFLWFELQNSTQKIHKQYVTNKCTNYEIFYLIHKRKIYKNRNFNFYGKVDAASQQLAFQYLVLFLKLLRCSHKSSWGYQLNV